MCAFIFNWPKRFKPRGPPPVTFSEVIPKCVFERVLNKYQLSFVYWHSRHELRGTFFRILLSISACWKKKPEKSSRENASYEVATRADCDINSAETIVYVCVCVCGRSRILVSLHLFGCFSLPTKQPTNQLWSQINWTERQTENLTPFFCWRPTRFSQILYFFLFFSFLFRLQSDVFPIHDNRQLIRRNSAVCLKMRFEDYMFTVVVCRGRNSV